MVTMWSTALDGANNAKLDQCRNIMAYNIIITYLNMNDARKIAQFSFPGIAHITGGRERSGSVVKCLTQDQGVAGLSLTSVTALCP